MDNHVMAKFILDSQYKRLKNCCPACKFCTHVRQIFSVREKQFVYFCECDETVHWKQTRNEYDSCKYYSSRFNQRGTIYG